MLFFAFFIMFGIGIPVAAGIAVMRYRLWELDVILKKTIVATVLVVLLTIVALVVLIAVGGIVVGPLSESPGIALLARDRRRGARPGRCSGSRGGSPIGSSTARRATPYEVLTQFSDRMAESYATDDVLPRMASILGAGTGRQERHDLAARRRASSDPLRPGPRAGVEGPTRRRPTTRRPSAGLEELTGDVFVVRHQGEQLGAITATMHANDPMDPTKEKLVRRPRRRRLASCFTTCV